jgi:hypothetical protein
MERVTRVRSALAVLLFAAVFPNGAPAQMFSHRPAYVDPSLGGWAALLETLCYQAGCGELYYVAGVYLGERGELRLLVRSKVTLREIHRQALGAFAQRLAGAVSDTVRDLTDRGAIQGVVLTFYLTALRGNVRTLEVYESSLPSEAFSEYGPVPLRIVERRVDALPPP